MRTISAVDRYDPNFKRLLYLRYADDFVILVIGSYEEALRIKRHVKDFLLKNTGLILNEDKTLVTSTRDPFNFLGATCKRVVSMGKLTRMKGAISKRAVPRMRLDIPTDELMKKFIKNHFCRGIDAPTARKDMVNLDHNDIIMFYNSKISGLVEFYNFARNYSALNRFM